MTQTERENALLILNHAKELVIGLGNVSALKILQRAHSKVFGTVPAEHALPKADSCGMHYPEPCQGFCARKGDRFSYKQIHCPHGVQNPNCEHYSE